MANMFETGAAFVASKFASYASEEVLYQHLRSGLVHKQGLVTATAGMSDHDVTDFEGVVVRHWSFDWIVDYDDLLTAIDSDTTHQWPERGDTILRPDDTATETLAATLDGTSTAINDGTWHVYEIGGETGTAVYELVDPYNNLVRIHTKYLGKQTLAANDQWPPL